MRKQKKYHYIYKTTCDVSGRYYVGMHSTDNIDDGYMGSGKRLWHSFNYHGKDNHTVEILEYYDTRKELREREKELVNENTLKDEMCMNLVVGGDGGYISKTGVKKGGEVYMEKYGGTDVFFDCRSKGGKTNFEKNGIPDNFKYDWNGKSHSEETKENMRKSKNVGKANSQFGTCWITKEGSNKKIKKEDLSEYLEIGWTRGRS